MVKLKNKIFINGEKCKTLTLWRSQVVWIILVSQLDTFNLVKLILKQTYLNIILGLLFLMKWADGQYRPVTVNTPKVILHNL